MLRTLRFVLAFATLAVCVSAAQAATITVTNDSTVSPGSGTCTLAQAIAASNAANGINAAWIGSAATTGNCATADASPSLNTIVFATNVQATQVFTATDNWWYGPNALPPIASVIAIDGGTTGVTLVASHIGDPTPATANAFRFFYVSGGLSGELPAGTLVLRNLSLSGGVAKGGEGGAGGGGAGMGGAIFNQGSLQLVGVTLTANSANGGGSNGTGTGGGGGGMGADPTGGGGGFGGSLGGMYGGAGGTGAASGGAGGGGGFLGTAAGASAGNSNGATGGGLGALGGYGGGFSGSYGDGGGGGNGTSSGANGGGFGSGGTGFATGGGGGGGVGGGGGSSGNGTGGGGGFGGGGGYSSLNTAFISNGGVGGFGGGAGGCGNGNGVNGFGGGAPLTAPNSPSPGGFGGGAGMGGAIFNHRGSLTLTNVTMTGNTASGGGGSNPGSGLGGAIFNLNGNIMIQFSTLANNSVSGNNGSSGGDAGDATVYSLAYGNKIQDGSASNAALTIANSIVVGTMASYGAGNDDVVSLAFLVNTATLTYTGANLVGLTSGTSSGPTPSTAAPNLGALANNGGPTQTMALNAGSAAFHFSSACVSTDQRGYTRPANHCDAGAYEDTVFFDGFESN